MQDTEGNAIPLAKVHVSGIDHYIMSAADGDYWRIIAPGTFNVRVTAEGYEDSAVETVTVPECTMSK